MDFMDSNKNLPNLLICRFISVVFFYYTALR